MLSNRMNFSYCVVWNSFPKSSHICCCPSSLQNGKESEYQYDYVEPDSGSIQHDRVVGSTTSGGVHA